MAENILENMKDILKKINSVSFLQQLDDNGQTVLFIPAWTVAVAIVFFILLLRVRRAKRS